MAPRPRTGRSTTPALASPPLVRDFIRQGGAIRIQWDVRTTYDFLFSLSDDAGSTDDLPADDRRWLTGSRESLRAQVGSALEVYGSELCIMLAGLAVDRAEVTNAAGFLRLLAATPTDEIVRGLVAEDLRNPKTRETTQQALDGDESAIDSLLHDLAEAHHGPKVERFGLLFRDPRAILDRAQNLLVRWLPFFAEIEPRVAAMLHRDFELRADDRRDLEPPQLIERTTGVIRWLSKPGVRRVILAPSYFTRPYNFLLGGDGWRFFGYPIADAALDGSDPLAPPQAVLRLHLPWATWRRSTPTSMGSRASSVSPPECPLARVANRSGQLDPRPVDAAGKPVPRVWP